MKSCVDDLREVDEHGVVLPEQDVVSREVSVHAVELQQQLHIPNDFIERAVCCRQTECGFVEGWRRGVCIPDVFHEQH